MAETQVQKPIDLNELGTHIGETLAAHRERHDANQQQLRQTHREAEKNRVRAEREQKLDALAERFRPFERVHGESTPNYEILSSHEGIRVSVAANGVRGFTARPLDASMWSLVSKEAGSAGARYIEKGPYSADEEATKELFAIESMKAKEMQANGGVVVSLNLESPLDPELKEIEGTSATQDRAHVAVLLDPESLLIVEERSDGSHLRKEGPLSKGMGIEGQPLEQEQPLPVYGKVIGPDDKRFGLVMNILDQVSQGVAADPQISR